MITRAIFERNLESKYFTIKNLFKAKLNSFWLKYVMVGNYFKLIHAFGSVILF